jgi:hypothetical protein
MLDNLLVRNMEIERSPILNNAVYDVERYAVFDFDL